jgi:ribonuclease HI
MDIRKFFPVVTNNKNCNFFKIDKDGNINKTIIKKEVKKEILEINNQPKLNMDSCEVFEKNNIHHIFTDGSTFNNNLHESKRHGGVGVYFEHNDIPSISYTLTNCKISNNVAELTAIKLGIETIIKYYNFNFKDIIKIYSDSQYSIDCFQKYCKQWQRNGWKKYNKGKGNKEIKNIELIKIIWGYYNQYKIQFQHVRSHTLQPNKESKEYRIWYGNDMADKLAVKASKVSQLSKYC